MENDKRYEADLDYYFNYGEDIKDFFFNLEVEKSLRCMKDNAKRLYDYLNREPIYESPRSAAIITSEMVNNIKATFADLLRYSREMENETQETKSKKEPIISQEEIDEIMDGKKREDLTITEKVLIGMEILKKDPYFDKFMEYIRNWGENDEDKYPH